jgi:3-phosphoshikimate 1-carboxyvinyltransferase
VVLPSSKSICNRALVINTLGRNSKHPENLSDCDDTRVMVEWLSHNPDEVNIGAAGTAMRFSTALLAVSSGSHIITGTERMKNRPIAVLVDALRDLGAEIEYVEKEGFPPLRIKGNMSLEGGEISLPGNVSSQYISALLMIGPSLKKGLRLVLTDDIVSRPYINMTISMMREFGAKVCWVSENSILVEPVAYTQRDYYVESDWSAASYWYEILALSSNDDAEIELPGLFAKSLQGDSKGAQVFDKLGVITEYGENTIKLRKSSVVAKEIDYNFLEMPDLAQTFVVTCCMLGVHFHFTGLQSLKIKETDRIEALKTELKKLGYVIRDVNDSELIWTGERCDANENIAIDTYEDHRMAMSFAPVSLKLGQININNPEVVSKSYPKYWDDLISVGFEL